MTRHLVLDGLDTTAAVAAVVDARRGVRTGLFIGGAIAVVVQPLRTPYGNPEWTDSYWWHILPDGKPLYLGAFLGAFANDDLLTAVGRVRHDKGTARWRWPEPLASVVSELPSAHVVIDSQDVVYLGLRSEVVVVEKNGEVWWRYPLPKGAVVVSMAMGMIGPLWVGLQVNGTTRIWALD